MTSHAEDAEICSAKLQFPLAGSAGAALVGAWVLHLDGETVGGGTGLCVWGAEVFF
jgi:hypothetical protein